MSLNLSLISRRAARGQLVPRPAADVAADADLAKDLRFGWVIIFLFFGVFMGWAAFARLDAAAFAQGQISVAGHRQTLQNRDGGRVTAVLVKEGQHVEAGQVLITLDPGAAQAVERSAASQVISLLAQRARLTAERSGQGQIARPVEFDSLDADEMAEADQALRVQAQELHARQGSVSTQKGVLAQRSRQLGEQIAGYRAQESETAVQSKLVNDQVASTQTLVDQGYAPTNTLKNLQISASGYRGRQADLSASASSASAQIAETQMQAASLDAQHLEEVSKDLRDVENQLNDLQPKLLEFRAQLAGTQIKAPVAGKVVGLTVFSAGGVVAPGQSMMDILPDAAPMLIEAQVSPNDADDLYVGQETEIKITAFHERSLPILKGAITNLSADSLVDQRTGVRYFTAEVTVPVDEINRLMDQRGHKDALRPGLPVQVLVPLRKRTALQYMFEPLTQALWRSGREH